jgi:signal transduction histidine kinase
VTPPGPGRSGLGLPLVKLLAEGAGGKLAIESGRGKGTTVEILFPAAS